MTQEALKLALEALENSQNFVDASANAKLKTGWGEQLDKADKAITAIKEALAQSEQEPVDCKRCNRLEDALKRANGLAEHFERAWYLRGDEIERLTAQPKQEPVAIMREMLEVQGQHGNWNYDSYMHGLYNGMEYMVALAEKREPKFRDAPDDWLAKYEVKRDNFNSTEPLTEATPPKQEPVKYSDYEPDGVHHNKPPQRTWVRLTDEEMLEAIKPLYANPFLAHNALEVSRDEYQAIEAKLKEKNT